MKQSHTTSIRLRASRSHRQTSAAHLAVVWRYLAQDGIHLLPSPIYDQPSSSHYSHSRMLAALLTAELNVLPASGSFFRSGLDASASTCSLFATIACSSAIVLLNRCCRSSSKSVRSSRPRPGQAGLQVAKATKQSKQLRQLCIACKRSIRW